MQLLFSSEGPRRGSVATLCQEARSPSGSPKALVAMGPNALHRGFWTKSSQAGWRSQDGTRQSRTPAPGLGWQQAGRGGSAPRWGSRGREAEPEAAGAGEAEAGRRVVTVVSVGGSSLPPPAGFATPAEAADPRARHSHGHAAAGGQADLPHLRGALSGLGDAALRPLLQNLHTGLVEPARNGLSGVPGARRRPGRAAPQSGHQRRARSCVRGGCPGPQPPLPPPIPEPHPSPSSALGPESRPGALCPLHGWPLELFCCVCSACTVRECRLHERARLDAEPREQEVTHRGAPLRAWAGAGSLSGRWLWDVFIPG